MSDYLKFYKNTPIRAVFLYTSEDREIQEYLDTNLSALDKLSGDSCLVFILVDQGESSESGYVFIEKLHVLRKANFNIYSQLPGLFFWDQHEITEFVSFGPKPSIADIVFILRVVFGEIRKSASISSVSRAKKILSNSSPLRDQNQSFSAQHFSEEPFHAILKKERECRGWSQEDLAQKLGCDLKTIGRWETGKALPQSFHRQALSQLLKKDLLELGLILSTGNGSNLK